MQITAPKISPLSVRRQSAWHYRAVEITALKPRQRDNDCIIIECNRRAYRGPSLLWGPTPVKLILNKMCTVYLFVVFEAQLNASLRAPFLLLSRCFIYTASGVIVYYCSPFRKLFKVYLQRKYHYSQSQRCQTKPTKS